VDATNSNFAYLGIFSNISGIIFSRVQGVYYAECSLNHFLSATSSLHRIWTISVTNGICFARFPWLYANKTEQHQRTQLCIL